MRFGTPLAPIAAVCASFYLAQVAVLTIPWGGVRAILFSAFILWPAGICVLIYTGWRTYRRLPVVATTTVASTLLLACLFFYPAAYRSAMERSAEFLQFLLVKHRLDRLYADVTQQDPTVKFVRLQTDEYWPESKGFAFDITGSLLFLNDIPSSCNPYTYNIYGPYYFFRDGC